MPHQAVAALVALALISSVSTLIMAGPRVYARMAQDGFLPCWREVPQFHIPGRPVVPLLFLGFVLFMTGFTAWQALRHVVGIVWP